ncbi:MAG: YhdT family protein [Synergistetes bacterium]|nr:YhdT family protein [Synergistota bacterium]MCX8127458.1 YhdT family protein [Synergistota bacterium]MDW8192765.1 YhdT family protein [Synergistota bacterium]
MTGSGFREDPRRSQMRKETIVVLVLFIANILWWFLFAYGLGSKSPKDYSYVMGFPAWFFWSCIASFIIFSVLVALVIPLFFKEIPLEPEEKGGVKK